MLSDYSTKTKTLTGLGRFGGIDTQARAGAGLSNIALSKPDLSTSQGLYQLAQQSGINKKADKVLAEKGEETKKMFGGGFVSDIFDALNVFQYGVVGMIKGKGFKKGVKTVASFTEGTENMWDVVGGIALDIAVDPLTYIAPWTILKKIPGVSKGAKAAKEVFKATKLGNYLGTKLVYRFGQDPIYKLLDERRIKNVLTGSRNMAESLGPLADITPDVATKMLRRTAGNRIIRAPLGELQKILSPEQFKSAKNLYNKIDDLGEQAVKLGLLGEKTQAEHAGEYIANLYKKYEVKEKISKRIFATKKIGIKGARFKVAQDAYGAVYQPALFTKSITKKFATKELRDEFLKKLGTKDFIEAGGKVLKKFEPLSLARRKTLEEITNAPYLLGRTTLDLIKDVENARLFDSVSTSIASKVVREGFQQLPVTTRLGKLAGQYVPKPIFDSIQEITKIKEPLEQAVEKIVAGFKFGKVVMNPATHARNVVSNTILNWWKLGIGPWRVDKYARGIKSILKKDDFYKRALAQGADESTYAFQEISSLLLGADAKAIGGKMTSKWKKVTKKLGSIYQGEEHIAKMTAFVDFARKGIADDKAWKLAESATFNYAQITPFIRKLRTSLFGFPFITFTTKTTPLALETILKAPHRVSAIGKVKNAIENLSDIKMTAKERAAEPAWVRNGFYIKLPIKDKYGRSSYFDLTYIIPFGDLISGDFAEPQVSRETGLKEGVVPAFSRKSPAINLIRELTSNQDFYGNKIFRESDSTSKQLGDVFRHVTKMYLPPLVADQIPGGYYTEGKLTGQRRPTTIPRALGASPENQQRTIMQEMLRNVGLKIQPIDADIQETYMEWEKKKALESLLRDAGVLKDFSTTYIPKK